MRFRHKEWIRLRFRFRHKDWHIHVYTCMCIFDSSYNFTIICQHILATAVRDLIMASACDSSCWLLLENAGTPHNPTNTPVRKTLLLILMTRRLSKGGWAQTGLWGHKVETI